MQVLVTVADHEIVSHQEGSGQFRTAHTVGEFTANLADVKKRIAQAAASVDRDPGEIRLLPVSKTVSEERLRHAVAAGMDHLGENKVQEAHRKWQNLNDLGVKWSVIGHLQTNKAKFVAEFATEFQALSSIKMAQALDRRLQDQGRSLDVFVQVNTSNEPQKFGLPAHEVGEFLAQMPQFNSLNVKGLMTLAVFSKDVQEVGACFDVLRNLRTELEQVVPNGVSVAELSMGMSGDYELAVAHGATVVRVGQAIFGSRQTPDSMYWPGQAQSTGKAGA